MEVVYRLCFRVSLWLSRLAGFGRCLTSICSNNELEEGIVELKYICVVITFLYASMSQRATSVSFANRNLEFLGKSIWTPREFDN